MYNRLKTKYELSICFFNGAIATILCEIYNQWVTYFGAVVGLKVDCKH